MSPDEVAMKSLLAVAFLLISAQAFAYDQTFESCSLTAWSIFENLQQYQLHVPLEKLKATKCKDGVPKYATECTNVDTAYSMAKSAGIDTAYIAAQAHYIKCSGEVQSRVGKGPLPQLESGYRECARSSGTRANILAVIKQGTPIEVTRDKMGAPYYDLIDTLYRKARDTNLTSVLDDSSRAAVACIEAVEATERSSSEQSPDKTKKVLADRLDAAASGQPLVKEGGSAATTLPGASVDLNATPVASAQQSCPSGAIECIVKVEKERTDAMLKALEDGKAADEVRKKEQFALEAKVCAVDPGGCAVKASRDLSVEMVSNARVRDGAATRSTAYLRDEAKVYRLMLNNPAQRANLKGYDPGYDDNTITLIVDDEVRTLLAINEELAKRGELKP
jgi:hypothetical protein